eukprot:11098638-Karenia_brevis.AAC.1
MMEKAAESMEEELPDFSTGGHDSLTVPQLTAQLQEAMEKLRLAQQQNAEYASHMNAHPTQPAPLSPKPHSTPPTL